MLHEQERSAQPEERDLALFSLIADPATIAGEANQGTAQNAHPDAQELERLRQALHAREQELESLRRAAASADQHAEPNIEMPELPAESPHPAPSAGELLDLNSAQRLAREAKQREQASRLALQTAQQALRSGTETPRPSAEAQINEQTWETRPLSVQRHHLEQSQVPPSPAAFRSSPSGRPERADMQIRAARAEVRELEATLAIARDTTITQKLEIARLRSELEAKPAQSSVHEMAALEEAFKSVLPDETTIDAEAIRIEAQNEIRAELDAEHHALNAEIERLRERVQIGEREIEAREAERRIFRETLAAREEVLQSTQAELEEVREQLASELETSEGLCLELEDERAQNAETQAMLTQLRSTLGLPVSEEPRSAEERPKKRERIYTRAEMPSVIEAREAAAAETAAQQQQQQEATVAGTRPGIKVVTRSRAFEESAPDLAAESIFDPQATFDAREINPSRGPQALFCGWQDDQVRRHFGPFGIDTTRDLVLAPLERRRSSTRGPAKILILGQDEEAWAEQLAEDLIAGESAAFELILASPLPPRRGKSAQPIDEVLSATPPPESPAELATLLADLQPSIVISRNFLSPLQDVGDWLAVLQALPRNGPALIFMESTGVGPIQPPEEMGSMGDRIWSLMPDRYTRDTRQSPSDAAKIESWQEAFAQMAPLPSNGLRAALRKDFEIEITAQFGFLAEPFLRSPIADHFDPAAQPDHRFLHQIADLDDRKIEAGVAPALHFVARVDGRAEG